MAVAESIDGCKLSFRDFIAAVAPRYAFYPHCERLIEVLQRVAEGQLSRVMVFMPPRHSKSETVSRLFPAYYLYLHPERFVGLSSYSADLAKTFSRLSRDRFLQIGGQMRSDSKRVDHWETTSGGGMWASGVGGALTGKGFTWASSTTRSRTRNKRARQRFAQSRSIGGRRRFPRAKSRAAQS
jgi:hypothetical protein